MKFPVLQLEIPLVDEENRPKGAMYRNFRKTPKNLPRLGERIYVMWEFTLEVKEISYSGPNLSWVHLVLEALPESYRETLEGTPTLGNEEKWKWRKD
jgi:hypothetical protein